MTEEPDRDAATDEKQPKNEMWEPSWSRGGLGSRKMMEADGMVFAGGLLVLGIVGFGWLIWKVVFQG